MRLSVDRGDPGYKEDVVGSGVKVYFNGKLNNRCITADEELGYILSYIDQDKIPQGTMAWPEEELWGTVVIEGYKW